MDLIVVILIYAVIGLIVGALARAWGSERLSAGKCVWFELDALPD